MRLTLLALAMLFLAAACGDDDGTPAPDAAPADAGVDAALPDAAAPDAQAPDCAEMQLEETTVPLADGKSLAATVRRPVNADCRMPTILIQTPYNKANLALAWAPTVEPGPLLGSLDYAFVVTDWRGFYGSSAAAVAQPDYGADGYDAVEWIAEQPWSDGQVGTWGVSALGRVQYWTATKRPPHLVAGVPIFSAINNTYDEYYPGGVLRREFLDTLTGLYGGSVVEDHPLHGFAWTYAEGLYDPADIAVPLLVVAGWYDLWNGRSFDDLADLRNLGDPAARQAHRLLAGPWHHYAIGGESAGGRMLTPEELVYSDSDFRVQAASLAWFDHWMRGIPGDVPSWPVYRWFEDEDPAVQGSDTWPTLAMNPQDPPPWLLYLDPAGGLLEDGSLGTTVDLAYDPDDPSPTIGGQTLQFDLLHGPQDQAEVIARSDALVFVTAPLGEDAVVRGPVQLFVGMSTTGEDTDLVARLTDVSPDGTHLLLTDGAQRLSVSEDRETRIDVVPGQRYPVRVRFTNHVAHRFPAGHRVGLIVTSSNAPRFDPNPNNGDPFYTTADASIAVTNTLHLDALSFLSLPVAP
jgi:hypothetical protein